MKGASHTITKSMWLPLSEATKLRKSSYSQWGGVVRQQEESEKVEKMAVTKCVQTVSLTTWKSTGISAQQYASSRPSVLHALKQLTNFKKKNKTMKEKHQANGRS